MHRRLAAAAAVVAAAAAVPFATAAPTCTGSVPDAACGGRVVPEPLLSATFIQYDTEIFPVLDTIEAIAPEVVESYTLDELTGNAADVSADGRKIPVVRLTDESKPAAGKRKVTVALSIHGNESAGREGGVRWIEDVARWWAEDPTHPVYSGDVELPLDAVLAQTEVWLAIPNPDGWAYGDVANGEGATFQRGNGNGTDLNRQFPTIGWHDASRTPLSEPEAVGWARFVRSLGKVSTSTDIHGELTSANNAFADLMWPADQWTPKEQAQELQLGRNVVKTIQRKFDEYGVVLGDITGASQTMKPAAVATGYDVVGYDDSGFLGDWFTQETGAIDIDAENFLSHLAPGNVWIGPLEEAHVAAVRGIIESVVVESMVTDQVQPKLDLGRVAYVFDPARVTGGGGGTEPYDVTRMLYFEHLAATGATVVPVDAADVASGTADLASYDSVVLADTTLPADRLGRAVDASKFTAALDAYAKAGGQLVLTDSALKLLASFGFAGEGMLSEAMTNAGHVDFGERGHPWEEDVEETASQTYYEVPLGFPAESAAPHFGVSSEAWEAAGGTTVGTVDPDGDQGPEVPFTALGELPYGTGKVSIFGAILPQPTADYEPRFGLANYGVTIAGGQVLHSMLSYRRPGSTTGPTEPPPPSEPPAPAPTPTNPRPPLPSTGWDPHPVLLGVPVALALLLRRRRRATAG